MSTEKMRSASAPLPAAAGEAEREAQPIRARTTSRRGALRTALGAAAAVTGVGVLSDGRPATAAAASLSWRHPAASEATMTDTITGVINVKQHGAVGNGITDDTAAIQKAAPAAVGKTLYFPDGTYLVSGTITIGDNTVVTGAGMYNSMIMYTGGPWITGILVETEVTTGGLVPPRGSIQFRNILYVVEPPSSGNVAQGNAGIWVKGLPLAGYSITHVTFEGWGDIEHAAFGLRMENVLYGAIGPGWQVRGNEDTEIALIGCQGIDINKPEVAPTLNTGKGLTLDTGCRDCSVDCVINTSSGAPAVLIADLGQHTRYPGVYGPAGNAFVRGARKMVGPNTGGSGPYWNGSNYVVKRRAVEASLPRRRSATGGA
jgi:hypothetical protein